ncbi:hypothetical protein CCR75_008546 [Bremia lactucae]|uniref:Fanconi anemia group M protein n=1 Tax=Bremia lactucae TaxID=4779 RepID=A0A976FGJ4_BRELC|nr:hypothetical protein CCR75_004955 [Bremia lactucae]TDH65613.1 hypothetical protein CCR75_000690 [Bremia lactucae]TDH65697.1 hypothetical protein CCR75_009255 [Bremia lactucae]TDH65988.1 hypothetical protein CCR75_001840 [Bremia lactucae]TDH66177.1 hypothetical protein CCR75_008462 [Bremia lactucae]
MQEDIWDDALLSEIEALETRYVKSCSRLNDTTNIPQSAFCYNKNMWSCKSCTLQNNAARTTCQVCQAPRVFMLHEDQDTTSAKKIIQTRITFDKSTTSPPQQQSIKNDGVCSKPTSFTLTQRDQLAKSATANTTHFSLKSPIKSFYSKRAKEEVKPDNSLLQTTRRATGEDAVAKTRYLDISIRSKGVPGIDIDAAQHFVYPTNYSIRDYQLAIAEKALYHNTLVSLPTGLGKTLVAAVVMYNFYRWFPTGKVVFMAPTKPLVAQQIKACHEIMGIPLSDTAELQGNVPPTMRRVLWNSRRVFFCTPQSLQNDLCRGICKAETFVCIIVDEAHRATGKYAYCAVVHEIEAKTQQYRILALSATPGAKFDVIQDVVTNLRISHIESRSADDVDVRKYTHARQEEVIVCRLGDQILKIKAQFLKLFTPIIQRLLRNQIIRNSDPDKLTSWYVLQARENFRKSSTYASKRSAESDLALLVSLLHAKSLLTGHGLNSFRDQILNWVEERKNGKLSWSKREMLQSSAFQVLETSLALSGDSLYSTVSHPKLLKLREVLLEHFQRHDAGASSTRAIVFTQFRASVSEIVALLRPLAPIVNAQPFIGQGASGKAKENKGQSQKVQQEIVRRFRKGDFNVLVATCIAEEGLDIGEVDLIVSFDALTSPVRMIQRLGRTGRKRVGNVIILVTEGDEQKKLMRSTSAAKTVSRALTTYKSRFIFAKCPRMLPTGIYPQLRELEMKIPTFHASQVGGKMSSTILDPNTWQLSDAERAVALLKFFPANFANSCRNKLVPIVADRAHLLRRQSRTLVRNNDSTQVSYSVRSLILLRLVRDIHGVDENLEDESDDDDSMNADKEEEAEVASSNNRANSVEHGNECHAAFLRSRTTKFHSTRLSIIDSKLKGEMTSASQQCKTPDEPDFASTWDNVYDTIGESISSFDTHFSPQYADLITRNISTTTEDVINCNGCCENTASMTLTGEKQKIDACKATSLLVPTSEDDMTEAKTTASGSKWPDSNVSRGAKKPTRDSTLSFKNVSHHNFSNRAETASQTCRTRQLVFDENAIDANPLTFTQTMELLPTEPAREAQVLRSKKHETPRATKENFSELPPVSCAQKSVSAANEMPYYEEQTENELQSFELLPSLSNGPVMASNLLNVSLRAASPDKKFVGAGIQEDKAHERVDDDLSSVVANESSFLQASNINSKTRADSDAEDMLAINPMEFTPPSKRYLAEYIHGATHTNQKEVDFEHKDDGCCAVCLERESYDDDLILFCDGCNVGVHQFCYGILSVPDAEWFCAVCSVALKTGNDVAANPPRCQLCPHRGGAYKRTGCHHWVHVQCYIWIPELQVEQGVDDSLMLSELTRLDPDRKNLDCSICHSQIGNGKIQCAHKQCLTAFHVSCAAFAGYRMDQVDVSGSDDKECYTLFLAYCSLHRKSSAPVCASDLSTLPEKATVSLSHPSLSKPANIASPSHLLASPSSAEVEKKRKKFRRLKRKYEYSPSHLCSQPEASRTLQKRLKRKKKQRETSRALAAAYIEETAEVQGGDDDDDDDDNEYGEDDQEAADNSFINDSSQLLYSQSVKSYEDVGDLTSKKKLKSSPNMRAIYAQSLCASQTSPLPLGRHWGALRSNGIIRACLDKMHTKTKTTTTPTTAVAVVEEFQAACDQRNCLPADTIQLDSPTICPLNQTKRLFNDTLHTEMETNGIETFNTLEENRQENLKQTKSQTSLVCNNILLSKDDQLANARDVRAIDSFHLTKEGMAHDGESAAYSHYSNGTLTCKRSLVPAKRSVTSTVDLTCHHSQRLSQSMKWNILVSSTFASSKIYAILLSSKSADCGVTITDSLHVDVLLSVRTAVLFLTSQQVHALKNTPPNQNEKSGLLFRLTLAMHKKVIVAVVHTGEKSEIQRILPFPNVTIIVQDCIDTLCSQLHQIAHEDLVEGYEFPSLCLGPLSDQVPRALDENFASRLEFFRSIPALSLDSALNLSFRFKNFSVTQVPVHKFNEMHWRRMLPWISEASAVEIQKHVQNIRR